MFEARDAVARADVHGGAAVVGGQQLRDEPRQHPLLVEVREAALLLALLADAQLEPEPVEVLLRFLRTIDTAKCARARRREPSTANGCVNGGGAAGLR